MVVRRLTGVTMADEGAGESHAPTVDVVDWVLRVGFALLFVNVGSEKLFAGPASYWLTLFHKLGFGLWFMYFTGTLQVIGGLLLLVPKTALIGLVLLGATMAGAVGCHLFLLDTGIGGAIIPGTILIFLIVTAHRRFRDRSNQDPVIIRL
jgi:putative oxidoreductase